jgi:hypothetical protein
MVNGYTILGKEGAFKNFLMTKMNTSLTKEESIGKLNSLQRFNI